MRRLKPRRWIAWKLVQLAYRICDTEYYQTIAIQPPSPGGLEIRIRGDAYGGGIDSTSGIRWKIDEHDARHMTADVHGWTFRWDETDDTREAE